MKGIAAFILFLSIPFAVLGGCGKSDKAITSFEDARHARIGVMTGSVGETVTRERFPEAVVKTFDDIMDAIAALKSGQLDAVVTTFPTVVQALKKNSDLMQLPERLDNEETAIALRKGDDDLLNALNGIITELKSDGTLDSMKKRWFKADLSPYEELNITPPKEGKVLKVGVSATREPFSFVDKDGRVTGHDGELARIIGARLNRPIEFLDMKFMALIPALQSGKVDIIVTGMTATDERKKTVNFTQSYFTNAQVMAVKKSGIQPNGPAKLATPEDIKDKRVGVLLGGVHDTYVMNNYPKATLLQYKSPSDLLLAVKSGKVDVAMYTRETLYEIFRGDPELGFVGEAVFTLPIGMGFNKSNDPLVGKFNAFLKQIRESGVYGDMIDRWMTKGDTAMPAVPNARSNGVLVVGNVSDKGMPFTIVKDNKLIGFDIELAERFGAFLGKEVKFADMEFGSLIAAVSSGKVDMIASTVVMTEERKKQIAFSDPYYEIGASVFALKKNIASSDTAAASGEKPPSFFNKIAASFYGNIILENRYLLILDGLKTTVVISIFATVFGTLLGALVCFMRMSRQSWLNLPARTYIAILRGTPVLVMLMLIFYVVFASVDISPVIVAVIAFGMNFAAYVAEMYRSGIESIDKGQTEAGVAMGFTRIGTFIHIILPQTARRILPVYKGEFISLVKMTSIVGYIAVQDLTKAGDIIRSRTFDAFFPLIMVAVLYFGISWILMQSLEYLEWRTDPKHRRRTGGAA